MIVRYETIRPCIACGASLTFREILANDGSVVAVKRLAWCSTCDDWRRAASGPHQFDGDGLEP